MNKENILFSIVGLLLGLIIGFMFANSVNQRGYQARNAAPGAGTTGLPPDHPALPSNGVAEKGPMPAEIQSVIQQAKNDPQNFEAQMKAAELYYQIKRYNEALEYLMKANQLRPDSYEAVVALGNTNFDAENYTAAEKWYTAALAKKPDDVNVRTDLGLTYVFRTPPDYDRAIREFRRSLETNPKHEQTLQNITYALSQKGEKTEAQATLKRLEEVNPNNQAIARLRSQIEGPGAEGGTNQ